MFHRLQSVYFAERGLVKSISETCLTFCSTSYIKCQLHLFKRRFSGIREASNYEIDGHKMQ